MATRKGTVGATASARSRFSPPPRWKPGWKLSAAALMLLLGVPAATLAGLDLRLRQGPLAADLLIGRIEAAINQQAAPLRVTVGGAQLRYDTSNDNSFGVLLSQVEVTNAEGAKLARVPSAGVDLEWTSLLTGSVVPTGLSLQDPVIEVRYAAGRGLVVKTDSGTTTGPLGTTAGQQSESQGQPSTGWSATVAGPEPQARAESPDVLGLLKAVAAKASGPGTGQSKLTSLHIRNAKITFGDSQSAQPWTIEEFDFHLQSPQTGGTLLVGAGKFVAPGGPANATVAIEQTEAGGDLRVSTSLDHIVPADLAGLSPALLPLAPALLPVGGEASLVFDGGGTLLQLDMKVGLGKGQLDVGGACAASFRLDQGGVHIKYVRGTGRVELLPSELDSNGSAATVSGLAIVSKDADGRDRWQYNVELANVRLADPANNLPPLSVDDWNARGTFTPATGEAVLDRMALQAGQARLVAAGRIAAAGLDVEARVQDAAPGLVLRLWPACFQSYARNWVLANVRSGTISKGHMRMALDAAALQRLSASGKVPDEAATAEFSVDDIAFTYADGLPPVIATHGDMQFAGRRFTANLPDAASQMPSGRVLTLTNAHYEVPDFLDPSPRGRIQLEAAGPVETGLEYLNAKPLGLVSASGLRFTDLIGDFNGKLDLELPVTRLPRPGDLTLKASASLKSLRLRRPIGGYTLQGGTIDVEASESSLRADGDLLINGVVAKLLWARPLGAGTGPVPPIRLAATLDPNDRDQLGILVNHMVAGDVPVTIDLAAGPDDGSGKIAHVEANLSPAELVVDTLAWRKPEGDPATVSFDAVPSDKGRTRLENFRLVGDRIAISGGIELGSDNKLAAFHFPDFSINVITQLDVAGKVRADKVLEVLAQGRFFDGRDFFRALFSIGQITAKKLPPPKATAGLDLTADIDTVLGDGQVSLHKVHLHALRIEGVLNSLKAAGTLDGGQQVSVALTRNQGEQRYLTADTGDAGRAFGLIGLYSGLEGGSAQLKVNLDGAGAAEKTGTLTAKNFVLLGDPVVNQVLDEAAKPGSEGKKRASERPSFDFDRLQVQFSVGDGQLIVHDMFIHGPVLGATMRGRIDYGRQTVQLGGTYIPLYGLNSMFGALPLFGPILVGRTGEGLLGITFAVDGPLSKPEVVVNPVSVVAPGIFRQIFEIGPNTPEIAAVPNPKGRTILNGQPEPNSGIGDAFPPETAEQAGRGTPPQPAVQ